MKENVLKESDKLKGREKFPLKVRESLPVFLTYEFSNSLVAQV